MEISMLFFIIAIILLLVKDVKRMWSFICFFIALYLLCLHQSQMLYVDYHLPQHLLEAFINSLKAFNFDLDYNTVFLPVLKDYQIYYAYAYILYFVSPIISGFVILDVLVHVFPTLKLWMNKISKKEFIIFSGLNLHSLNYYRTMKKEMDLSNSCVIFMNVLSNEQNEDQDKLIIEARKEGAFALEEDLPLFSFQKNWFKKYKKIKYYFMVKDDIKNIDDTIYICDEGSFLWKGCEKVDIYLYAQQEVAVEVVETIYEKQDVRNLHIYIIPYLTSTIYRLLDEFPLYDGLKHAQVKEDLKIVVIGDDLLSLEIIKNVYWLGQFSHKSLKIISISQKSLESQIKHMIPNIEAVDNDYPYCELICFESNFNDEAYDNILDKDLNDAQFFFISLQDDFKNLECAQYIKSRLLANEMIHLHSKKNITIHYHIDSNELMKNLNKANQNDFINLNAFGSYEERYSVYDVFGSLHDLALVQENAWNIKQKVQPHNYDNEYKRRSSLAWALYTKNRMYELGITTSNHLYDIVEYFVTHQKDYESLKIDVAYIEHRRWNAYMRSLGFRTIAIEQLIQYYGQANLENKNIRLKYHSCICEFKKENGFLKDEIYDPQLALNQPKQFALLDELDKVSYYMWLKEYMNAKDKSNVYRCDYKVYDYSIYSVANKYIKFMKLKQILGYMNLNYYTKTNEFKKYRHYIDYRCFDVLKTKLKDVTLIDRLIDYYKKGHIYLYYYFKYLFKKYHIEYKEVEQAMCEVLNKTDLFDDDLGIDNLCKMN